MSELDSISQRLSDVITCIHNWFAHVQGHPVFNVFGSSSLVDFLCSMLIQLYHLFFISQLDAVECQDPDKYTLLLSIFLIHHYH